MQLAISTVCLHDLDLADALARCRSAGYTNVELLMIDGWRHVDARRCDPLALAAQARELGISIVAVHAGAIDGADDASVERSIAYLDRVVAAAQAIGAGMVVANGGRDVPGCRASDRTDAIDRIASAITAYAPHLASVGVRLAVENHFGFQLQDIGDHQRLFARVASPWVGMALDTGHCTSAGIEPVHVAEAFGQRVIHVHIKDHIGTESKALGHGSTDNAALIRRLRASGYAGFLSVEMEVHDRTHAVRHVDESFPYMRSLIRAEELHHV